jgi:ABC-type iron transport system FetAB permease component
MTHHRFTPVAAGSAYIFVLILLVIVRIKGISREKNPIASLRMTLQLGPDR